MNWKIRFQVGYLSVRFALSWVWTFIQKVPYATSGLVIGIVYFSYIGMNIDHVSHLNLFVAGLVGLNLINVGWVFYKRSQQIRLEHKAGLNIIPSIALQEKERLIKVLPKTNQTKPQSRL